MTTSPTDPSTRPLTPTECRDWIAAHDEARLGFDTGRGHRSVVVGYAVTDDDVLLVLPEYHPALGYVVGAPVTLEIEAARGSAWERVRATGIAYPGDRDEVRLRPYGAAWPPGVATHPVHVSLARLEGVLQVA